MSRSFVGRMIPAMFTAISLTISTATAGGILLHAVMAGTATRNAMPVSTSGTYVAAVLPPAPRPAATPAVPPSAQPAAVLPAPPTGGIIRECGICGRRADRPGGGHDHGHR